MSDGGWVMVPLEMLRRIDAQLMAMDIYLHQAKGFVNDMEAYVRTIQGMNDHLKPLVESEMLTAHSLKDLYERVAKLESKP